MAANNTRPPALSTRSSARPTPPAAPAAAPLSRQKLAATATRRKQAATTARQRQATAAARKALAVARLAARAVAQDNRQLARQSAPTPAPEPTPTPTPTPAPAPALSSPIVANDYINTRDMDTLDVLDMLRSSPPRISSPPLELGVDVIVTYSLFVNSQGRGKEDALPTSRALFSFSDVEETFERMIASPASEINGRKYEYTGRVVRSKTDKARSKWQHTILGDFSDSEGSKVWAKLDPKIRAATRIPVS